MPLPKGVARCEWGNPIPPSYANRASVLEQPTHLLSIYPNLTVGCVRADDDGVGGDVDPRLRWLAGKEVDDRSVPVPFKSALFDCTVEPLRGPLSRSSAMLSNRLRLGGS